MNLKPRLVNLKKTIPTITLDLKYATENNFTNAILYPTAKCYLIAPAAEALKIASKEFAQLGYSLKIWDGYRPLSIQSILWKLMPDEKYVAHPTKGSRHNRGCAVDLTLIDHTGRELDMGTDFDDFTEKAHRDYHNFSDTILKNRHLLQSIMEKNHFIGWKHEWWHFDFKDWESYPLLDIHFDDIEK